MPFNGVCIKRLRGSYAKGYKYCSVCAIWVMCEDIKCNCCNMRLRVRSHYQRRVHIEARKEVA